MCWTPLHLSAHLILPPTLREQGPFYGGGSQGTEQQGAWKGGTAGTETSRAQAHGAPRSLHLPTTATGSAVPGGGVGGECAGAEGARRARLTFPARPAAPSAPSPPPLLAAPSLRRLAFHLRIFHAGLAWRRAVCGPHKGRRVLHSSRWGPAGEGAAAWRGARRPAGGDLACSLQQGPPSRVGTQPREFHIRKYPFQKGKQQQKNPAGIYGALLKGPRELQNQHVL